MPQTKALVNNIITNKDRIDNCLEVEVDEHWVALEIMSAGC